jgi:hypothetical protein
MNFQNTWYVIERKNKYEAVSHAVLSDLASDSYVMLQNFDTHQEALTELRRLIRLEIQDAMKKIDGLADHSK